MEPRTNLLNSLSTFRWGAQWGKLSKEGEFADKEGRTVSLLTLFIDTTSQLLDFLRYSHADSFELGGSLTPSFGQMPCLQTWNRMNCMS